MNRYRVTKATTTLQIFDVDAESEAQAVAAVAGEEGLLIAQNAAWSAVALSEAPEPEPEPMALELTGLYQ